MEGGGSICSHSWTFATFTPCPNFLCLRDAFQWCTVTTSSPEAKTCHHDLPTTLTASLENVRARLQKTPLQQPSLRYKNRSLDSCCFFLLLFPELRAVVYWSLTFFCLFWELRAVVYWSLTFFCLFWELRAVVYWSLTFFCLFWELRAVVCWSLFCLFQSLELCDKGGGSGLSSFPLLLLPHPK